MSKKIFGLQPVSGRWIYLILCLVINICLGAVYSYSVFKGPLEELWGISSTQSNMPYMIFLAFFALLMPFAGKMIDKLGPRIVMVCGGLVVGVGWILASYAPNIWMITLTYGVIAGAGVGISYGGPIAVAAKWFPDKKGLAVGLALTGFGLSAFITAPVATRLILTNGPLKTFGIMGGAFLIISIVLSLPMKFPPENWNSQLNNDDNKKSDKIRSLTVKEMLKTPKAYALWFCYTIGTTSGLMAIGISSPVGRQMIGLTPERAGFLVGIFAIFNGVGRPLFGWLTDKITPKKAAVVSFLIILISSLSMIFAKEGSVIAYILAFTGFWLCLGGWLAIAPTATATLFGSENYAQKYGIMYSAYGIGAIIGGIISGQAMDVFGSYSFAFIPIAIMSAFGIIVSQKLDIEK
ncbi:MAG: L-lactate MFS transporter [Candidatus Muiribacteriota bacterium]